MNRSDLVLELASKNNLPRGQVEAVVETVIAQMASSLSHGERIEIRGFGSFDLSYRPSRRARNPKSGETFVINSKYFPAFKAGKMLRCIDSH